jgi:DNA-binding CsgD family transcriptional regulator
MMSRMRACDVSVVEAAYNLRGDEKAWLRRILAAARDAWGVGLGATGYLYDARDPAAMRLKVIDETPDSPGFIPTVRRIMSRIDTRYVSDTYRALPCAMASETPGIERTEFSRAYRLGIRDLLGINGLDPTGQGAFVAVLHPAVHKLTAGERARFTRVSAHIASGYRLLRELRGHGGPVEAVLTPSGRTEHAEGEAQLRAARDQLADATRLIEKARGSMRADPDGALAIWRGLVSARWSLVDRFDRDGKRYVVARRNEALPSGLRALSPRERQVLGFAALGHSSKHIAYELGISPSTVRVLLTRCYRRLGVRTRAALLAAIASSDHE